LAISIRDNLRLVDMIYDLEGRDLLSDKLKIGAKYRKETSASSLIYWFPYAAPRNFLIGEGGRRPGQVRILFH